MKNQVGIAVMVYVFHCVLDRGSFGRSKEHCTDIYHAGIEVIISQNSYRDDTIAI